MRPIFLSVEGLACFKEKQEVDFSGIDLFAISGPTGAGKSTLLDAMLFALYGTVPRVGKQDLKEMISSSRDRVSVLFDFNVGDQRFRITRTLRRKGAATVRLEKHDGQDFNENVADQVRTAEDAILRILGLDCDAFTQAVVLPQGKFARFLQANPSDRRSMLRTLLRLEVYERMRDQAQRLSTTKKTARDSAQELLVNEYAGVTDKALVALETESKETQEKLEGLRKDRDAAQEQLTKIRSLHGKTEELAEKEKRLEELNEAAAGIQAAKAELQSAQRAGSLVPVLQEAARAADWAKRARAEADQAQIDHEDAVKAYKERERILQKANTAAAEIAPTREKVAKLDQILGRLPERDRLTRTIERQRTDLTTMKEKADGLRQKLDALAEKQRNQHTAEITARTALEGISYDVDVDAALEKVRELAAKLSVARERLKTATSNKMDRQKALTDLTGSIELLEREAKEASQAEAEAQKTAEAADAALHAAHRTDAANHLRESLAVGEACPVCEQVVNEPPPANLHPDIERAKTEREQAALNLKGAQKKAQEKQKVLTREQANLDAAQRAYDEADISHRKVVEAVSQQEGEIRTLLDGHGPKDDQVIDMWVEEQVRASSAARRTYEEAKQNLERAEHDLAKTRETQEMTKETLGETDKALRQLEQELKENEGELDELKKEIAKVTQMQNPERERDGLVDRINELELEQNAAAEAAADAKNQLTATDQALKLKAHAAEEAETGAAQRQKTRDEHVAQAGFDGAKAVEAAVRDNDVQTMLLERIQTHDRDLHAVEERINTLKEELGTERVSKEQLDIANKRSTDLTTEVEKLVGHGQKLEQQVDSMKKRLERSKELRKKFQAEEAAYRLYSHLASDLRSDKFQAYVLEETFTELVWGASARLLALTGERYSLEFAEDQIVVVDHDNAGETRISDTLSGGETFLTSLSLALELSDQVQRAAGAVNLDSLFIDEGFGTLDPDTLAVVSETIQSLQVGGRMVGIITHIPELRDEFSQQILVTKHQGYSTVEVRPVGEA